MNKEVNWIYFYLWGQCVKIMGCKFNVYLQKEPGLLSVVLKQLDFYYEHQFCFR